MLWTIKPRKPVLWARYGRGAGVRFSCLRKARWYLSPKSRAGCVWGVGGEAVLQCTGSGAHSTVSLSAPNSSSLSPGMAGGLSLGEIKSGDKGYSYSFCCYIPNTHVEP